MGDPEAKDDQHIKRLLLNQRNMKSGRMMVGDNLYGLNFIRHLGLENIFG